MTTSLSATRSIDEHYYEPLAELVQPEQNAKGPPLQWLRDADAQTRQPRDLWEN